PTAASGPPQQDEGPSPRTSPRRRGEGEGREEPLSPLAGRGRVRGLSLQAIVTLLILVVCGGLVIYPVLFLAEEALNIGNPQEFPLQEWGLGNFAALAEEWHVLGNTALVASVA